MHTSLINELAAAGGSAWGALEELWLYSLHDLTRWFCGLHSFGQHGRPLFVLCWRSMSPCSLIACSRDGCDRWEEATPQPPVLACVQHVDVNAATKTWIYFYALARVHCNNCCSHFKNSNTAGKAVWKILIIRLVSRPPTASLSATCLAEFITTRPLFMRPPIEEAPSPLLLLFVRWTRLISHAARSPNWALIIPCTCTLTISQCNDYGKL